MIGIVRIVIILLVAEETVRRRSLKLPVNMAGRAARLNVRAGQRETGIAMVESLVPAIRRVALQTIVRIVIGKVIFRVVVIFLMTRPAICRGAIELSVDMTLGAIDVHVPACQRIVRIIVIEIRIPVVCAMAHRAIMRITP